MDTKHFVYVYTYHLSRMIYIPHTHMICLGVLSVTTCTPVKEMAQQELLVGKERCKSQKWTPHTPAVYSTQFQINICLPLDVKVRNF